MGQELDEVIEQVVAQTRAAGVRALLLTDVEGSTALWQSHPIAADAAMARHHEIVAEVVAAHQGTLPPDQGEGDARFAVFASVTSAVQAAVALQRAFAQEPWPEPAALRVRMGLHVGETVVRDGNHYGEAVNRCARLRGLAHGGQLLVSAAAHALLAGRLPAGIELLDLGEHRMKDLTRPERVFQVLASGLVRDFPPLHSLESCRNNLPEELSSFVGREQEVADVSELVRRARLVTLTGPGGTGKTRLALHVAVSLAEEEADGVFLVDLTQAADASQVPSVLADALGVRDTGQGAERAVADELGRQRLLVVLDNVEHVVDWAPEVTRLLEASPGLRVLATSRVPLRVRGEHEYAVPPLPVPDRRARLEELAASPAVQLLVERGAAARPGFALSRDNAWALAAICSRLDGLPLALELAAARLRLLTPQALLARLDDALGLLTTGDRDAPDRHRTLRAAIDWSYQTLDTAHARLLDRMSVFVRGASYDDIEAVCGPGLRGDVLDSLASLVDHSLLRQVQTDGEPRFELLATIRDYAAEHLAERGEAELLRDRHAEHFLDRAEELSPLADGPRARELLDTLLREQANFRAALDTLTDRADGDEELRLASALNSLWWDLGACAEGVGRLRSALRRSTEDGELRCFARASLAWLLAVAGEESEARRSADLAVTEARALGDVRLEAYALQCAAAARVRPDDSEEAVELARTSMALAQATEAGSPNAPVRWGAMHPTAVRFGALSLIWSALHYEDPAATRELLDELLGDQGTLADPAVRGLLLLSRAQLDVEQGLVDDAEAGLDEAASLLAGYRTYEIWVSWWRARLALERGRLDDALAGFQRTRSELRGHLRAESEVLAALGEVMIARGDVAGAEELAVDATGRLPADQAAAVSVTAARALRLSGRRGEARVALDQAARWTRLDVARWSAVTWWHEHAALALDEEDTAGAARALATVDALLQQGGFVLPATERPVAAALRRRLGEETGGAVASEGGAAPAAAGAGTR